MNDSPVEPKRQHRTFYLGFALVAVLIFLLVVAYFSVPKDPLLYNNAVTVQVTTDKSFYTQGEVVSITVSVFNGKNEPVNCTTSIFCKVLGSTGQEVYSAGILITLPIPRPTYPAHSKYSYSPQVWNQKDSNDTLVVSGKYTIRVSLPGLGFSECEIEIADYWVR